MLFIVRHEIPGARRKVDLSTADSPKQCHQTADNHDLIQVKGDSKRLDICNPDTCKEEGGTQIRGHIKFVATVNFAIHFTHQML